MPELPEVTVIVNQLNKKLKGLVLKSIEYDWPKKFYWGKLSIVDLRGMVVKSVERRGKVVLINLQRLSGNQVIRLSGKKKPDSQNARQPASQRGESENLTILIHLKLTGQLIYQDAKTHIAGGHPIPPLNLPSPNKTTRVTFDFGNGGHLYFNDMRKFGWVRIVESDESEVKEGIGMELGPDPLKMRFEEFRKRLKAKDQSRIKKLLMDQSFIAGVGNIYSDEGLWRAKIHPKRSAISLSPLEIRKLYDGVRESLKLAIEKGGSSANSYVDSGGERGLYLSFAKAYHMTGKPCARCKTPIVREKMDGRSAHYCPACQRLKP